MYIITWTKGVLMCEGLSERKALLGTVEPRAGPYFLFARPAAMHRAMRGAQPTQGGDEVSGSLRERIYTQGRTVIL